GGTIVTLTGTRLLNANNTAPAVKVGGFAANVISATAGSPDQVVIMTPAGAPGAVPITVTTDRGTGTRPAAFTYTADPKTPFALESDTQLLWHLDELDLANTSQPVPILDAGPLSVDGEATGASEAVSGRFNGARRDA